jgi:hypothetical protein
MNYNAINAMGEAIEHNGALEAVRADLVSRCYEQLDKIQEISSTKGRGDELGRASIAYNEFIRDINQFLSPDQLNQLDKKYEDIKRGFPNTTDRRVKINAQNGKTNNN